MAFQTLSGAVASGASGGTPVAASGVVEAASGYALTALNLNMALRDLQNQLVQALLPGVQIQQTITASGLVLTIPTGFQYYARNVWLSTSAGTYTVPDNSTTYLWGCSDGSVRLTSSSTIPPTGFDPTTAILIVKATASSGTVTIDQTVQHTAQYANSTTRTLTAPSGTGSGIPSGALAHRSVSANTTITSSDGIVYVNASGGNITITLPDATTFPQGQIVYIKRTDNTSSLTSITLAGVSGQGVDTTTYPTSGAAWQVWRLVSNGTNWSTL